MHFTILLSWGGTQLLQGYWWIPGREVQELLGVLTLSDEGISLEVSGPFLDESSFGDLSQIDIVYGLTSRGQNVTNAESKVVGKFVILQNCLQTGQNLPFGNAEIYRQTPIFTYSALNSVRYTKYTILAGHQFDLRRNEGWI